MKTISLVCPRCGKYPFDLVPHVCSAVKPAVDSIANDSQKQLEKQLQDALSSLSVVGEHHLATVRAEKQLDAAVSRIQKALVIIKGKNKCGS